MNKLSTTTVWTYDPNPPELHNKLITPADSDGLRMGMPVKEQQNVYVLSENEVAKIVDDAWEAAIAFVNNNFMGNLPVNIPTKKEFTEKLLGK